jgi:hypothetical protein
MWVDARQGDDTMAKITALPSGGVIYNVSHSVGRHGRNLEIDVMPVKWLLNDLILWLMPPTSNKAISSAQYQTRWAGPVFARRKQTPQFYGFRNRNWARETRP